MSTFVDQSSPLVQLRRDLDTANLLNGRVKKIFATDLRCLLTLAQLPDYGATRKDSRNNKKSRMK